MLSINAVGLILTNVKIVDAGLTKNAGGVSGVPRIFLVGREGRAISWEYANELSWQASDYFGGILWLETYESKALERGTGALRILVGNHGNTRSPQPIQHQLTT